MAFGRGRVAGSLFGREMIGYRAGVLRDILRGVAAGAAGTTALNAATYLDMAVRGRPASDTPERTVESLTGRVGWTVPGADGARDNRLSGLGALAGITTGLVVGALAGALRGFGFRPPPVLGAVLTGAAAMAVTDVTLAGLKVSDPRTWSPGAWLSDVLPHLAYGATTHAILASLDAAPVSRARPVSFA